MNYEKIENAIKKFCECAYKDAEDYSASTEFILNQRAVAFGAVHFATNNLFPYYNRDLSNWWNREMRQKFQKLIEKNN